MWEIWLIKKVVEDCEKMKMRRFEKKKVWEEKEKKEREREKFLRVVSEKYVEWLEIKNKFFIEERRIKYREECFEEKKKENMNCII